MMGQTNMQLAEGARTQHVKSLLLLPYDISQENTQISGCEPLTDSVMSDSLEGIIINKNVLFDRDSQEIQTHKIHIKKPLSLEYYLINHLFGNRFMVIGGFSERALLTSRNLGNDEEAISRLYFLSIQYNEFRKDFDRNYDEVVDSSNEQKHLDFKSYFSKLLKLKKSIQSTSLFLSEEFQDELLEKYQSYVNKDLYLLQRDFDILDHLDKPAHIFDVIGSMYYTLQNDVEDPAINRVIFSLDNIHQVSDTHYESRLSDRHVFQIHKLEGYSDLYLVSEENPDLGLYQLHTMDFTGVLNTEQHSNKDKLCQAKNNNFEYFKHKAMKSDIDKNRKLLYSLEKKGVDISKISIDQAVRIEYKDGDNVDTVHSILFDYGGVIYTAVINGVNNSETIYRASPKKAVPHFVSKVLPELKAKQKMLHPGTKTNH